MVSQMSGGGRSAGPHSEARGRVYRARIRCCLILAAASLAAPAAGQAGQVLPLTWAEPIEVAAGDAFHGPWRMNESRFLFVDDPTVAVGAGGGVGVAWADQARKDIYFQMFGADGTRFTLTYSGEGIDDPNFSMEFAKGAFIRLCAFRDFALNYYDKGRDDNKRKSFEKIEKGQPNIIPIPEQII